jgi:hypothetical protein
MAEARTFAAVWGPSPRALYLQGAPPREFGAGEVVVLREVTADEQRSAAQLRYWFGAVVPTVRACWLKERGRDYLPLQVHAVLMTEFGDEPDASMVDTPLGPTYQRYPSSRFKSKGEFARITDRVREWVARRYPGVTIPSPDEWNGEDAA